jgi:hypothetical protein
MVIKTQRFYTRRRFDSGKTYGIRVGDKVLVQLPDPGLRRFMVRDSGKFYPYQWALPGLFQRQKRRAEPSPVKQQAV